MIPTCASTPGAARSGRFSTRGQIVLASCVCAGVSAFLYAVDPNRHAVYPECLLYQTTGLYCAGCGATRAFYALLHGRVLEALHDNALFIGALPFVVVFAGFYLRRGWRDNAWPKWELEPRAVVRGGVWIFLVLLLFMAVRNLPGMPFEWLKPLAASLKN